MIKNVDKDKQKDIDYNRRANIALGVGVFAVIFLPLLLTQLPSILDFTKTGQIGDTIGGITAPFVGLVGAILVYYSFKQQMIANDIQRKSIDELRSENLDNQCIKIVNDLSNSCVELIRKGLVQIAIGDQLMANYQTTKGSKGIDRFYEALLMHRSNSDGFMISELTQRFLLTLNADITLLITHINLITSDELRDMYLNLYYNQIHKIVYSKILQQKSPDVMKDHKYYDLWIKSWNNIVIYDINKMSKR